MSLGNGIVEATSGKPGRVAWNFLSTLRLYHTIPPYQVRQFAKNYGDILKQNKIKSLCFSTFFIFFII